MFEQFGLASNPFDPNILISNPDTSSFFSAYIHASSRWSGFLFKDEGEQEEKEEDGRGIDDDRIDAFQKWMTETDFSATKIILIDDADAFASKLDQYINAIKFEQLQIPTMVFCISPLTQPHIAKTELFYEILADSFWILKLDNDDIKEIILLLGVMPNFKVLGDIGNRRHYRCNRCGLEWNRKIEQIEANNKANEDYLTGVPKKR